MNDIEYVRQPDETKKKIADELRDQVTNILFDIHSLAMDASNEPTHDNIRAMQVKIADLGRVLPDYYFTLNWQPRK